LAVVGSVNSAGWNYSISTSDGINSTMRFGHYSGMAGIVTDTNFSIATSGAERIRVTPTGTVIIGTSQTDALQVISGATYLAVGIVPNTRVQMTAYEAGVGPRELLLNGSFSINPSGIVTSLPTYNNVAVGTRLDISSTGVFSRTSSSEKYKKDIENLDPALVDNAIEKLRPVWFRSKNPGCDDSENWSHLGLIAEEVAQVEPRLVAFKCMDMVPETKIVKQEDGTDKEHTEYKAVKRATPEPEAVQYDLVGVLLLSKVQRMMKHIETLEARIAALEAK